MRYQPGRVAPGDPRRRPRVMAVVPAIALALVGLWAQRLWHLRRQVERYRRHWEEPVGDPGGLLYVALGDSTAQGIGASEPDRGYVGLVADQLRTGTGRPVLVVNLSRTGARIADVVAEQLPRLAGLAPDLVTVAVGANDIRHYGDGARFRSDVDALVAGLPPGTVVGDVPWFMHGDAGRTSAEAAACVARGAERRGLRVARLQEAMRRRGWAGMATDYAADWFHLSNRGYRVWADAFWQAIGTAPARPSLVAQPHPPGAVAPLEPEQPSAGPAPGR